MLEHEARRASTQQPSGTPAALEEAHAGLLIVLFNRDSLSINRNIKGSLRSSEQARKDDKKRKTGGLREKCNHQNIDNRCNPNHTAAAVAGDELSRYRHGDERTDDETDQHKGERSVLKAKKLFEHRHMCRPGSEARSIHKKEHGKRPLSPFHRPFHLSAAMLLLVSDCL